VSRLDPAYCRQGSNVGEGDYRTRVENIHGTRFRELLLTASRRWVCVHEAIDEVDGVVVR
jgi:hypothetical protein